MNTARISFALAVVCVAPSFAQPAKNKVEGTLRHAARSERQQPVVLQRMAHPLREHSLGRLRPNESRPAKRKPGLTPVGTGRVLPSGIEQTGEWATTPEGHAVWRLSLRSDGAAAVRVRFTGFHAGSGQVWLLGSDEEGAAVSVGPYSGDGPFGDGEFWSDIVASEAVIVAYEPGSAPPAAVPFTLDQLSHRFTPLAEASSKAAAATKAAAASCSVDAACHPDYNDAASAVALIVFESEGSSYQCSGALIGSASQPVLPFFLTANHCIANSAEAKSVIAIFNYQTSSCNGTRPSLNRSPRVTGATFVAGGEIALGDYSLLQLTGFPNVDVKLLGWSAENLASNQQVTSISHPAGDYKRIALGERTRDVTIRYSDGTRMPANRGYQVSWFEGVTQGGSSGSPLIASLSGKPYLVGILSGGPNIEDDDGDAVVCRANNLIASFGRFNTAFPDLELFLTSIDGGLRTSPNSATPSLTATPLSSAAGPGVTTLTWQALGYNSVQIRVGSPDGVAMTGIEGPTGSAQTGPWATEGSTFYLQDASSGDSAGLARTIATVRVERDALTGRRSGSLSISPLLGVPAPGRSTITVTVNWVAQGVSRVQIRVGSPVGPALTGLELPVGSATTGDWVVNGTTFYLQDASRGESLGSQNTLATVQARVAAR